MKSKHIKESCRTRTVLVLGGFWRDFGTVTLPILSVGLDAGNQYLSTKLPCGGFLPGPEQQATRHPHDLRGGDKNSTNSGDSRVSERTVYIQYVISELTVLQNIPSVGC